MELESKSTDKLRIVCQSIEKNILSDPALKKKIKSINISWVSVDAGDGELMPCPKLEVTFYE